MKQPHRFLACLCLPLVTLTSAPASGQFATAPADGSPYPEITALTGIGPKPTGFTRLMATAVPLASSTSELPQGRQDITVYRTAFKYPLVRVVENFEDGTASPRRLVMVADHILTRVNAAERPALAAFLIRHPQVSVRSWLSTGEHVLLQVPDALKPGALDAWPPRLHSAGLPTAGPDYIQQADVVPNDTRYGTMWHLNNTGQTGGRTDSDIDAPEAWDVSTGAYETLVAVIDTGVDYLHTDLEYNMWYGPGGSVGYDYYDNDDDPYEGIYDDAHGTHVSGTIAASGNNALGVTGVAWQARIMGLRFLGPFGGATSDGISCIRYATDHGARIISNSWGGPGGFLRDALREEIVHARDAGALMMCSAGNDGDNADIHPHYPSGYTEANIISVAATDHRDAMASFSNYGAQSVDIAAPGKDILSTMPGDIYDTLSGTSMSTPLVTGAAALLLSANPDLTWSEIRTRILNSADKITALNGKMVTGGRLNASTPLDEFRGPVLKLTRKLATPMTGNGDLYANPGEVLRLDLTLRNVGSQTAATNTIAVSLSAGAPATLNRTSLSAGTLNPRTETALNDAFRLTLNNSATLPATFTVTYTLTSVSKPQPWIVTQPITVFAPATLHGRVTRAATGLPIPGAAIAFRGGVSINLLTGADGRYSAPAVAGPCEITASFTGLTESAPLAVNLTASTADLDFSLGTTSVTLNPGTIAVTVPPDRIRTFSALVAHTGDSPRPIPFQPVLTGAGLTLNRLYGIVQSGGFAVQEIEPATGSVIATHPLTDTGAPGILTAVAWQGGTLWQLYSVYTGVGPAQQWLRPLAPGTWTHGADVPLTTPADKEFAGMGSNGLSLLFTARNITDASYSLYEYKPATAALTYIGELPANTMGPAGASLTRNSAFIALNTGTGSSIAEYSWPDLTPQHEWDQPNATISGLACDDESASLFVSAIPQFGGPTPNLGALDPLTGGTPGSFTPASGPSFPAVSTAGGPGWLNVAANAEVASGTTLSLPLTFNTGGMTAGQTLTAQLALVPTIADAPESITVQLTVGDPPADDTWEGWFANRFARTPGAADRTGDEDRDGIPNLIEFLTGGDPQNPVRHPGAPAVTAAGNSVQFTFVQRLNLPAGTLIPQTSLTLADWFPLPAAIPGSTVVTGAADPGYERITITIPRAQRSALYLRLAAP